MAGRPPGHAGFWDKSFAWGALTGFDNKAFFSKIIAQDRFRSTIVEFIGELITPPPRAYRQTAHWIQENIKEKQSVVVLPNHVTTRSTGGYVIILGLINH